MESKTDRVFMEVPKENQKISEWRNVDLYKFQNEESLLKKKKKKSKCKKFKNWNCEEDNLLRRLFKIYGNKWKIIEKYFPNRTAYQLNYRVQKLIKNLSKNDFQNNSQFETTQIESKENSCSSYFKRIKKTKTQILENSFFENFEKLNSLFEFSNPQNFEGKKFNENCSKINLIHSSEQGLTGEFTNKSLSPVFSDLGKKLIISNSKSQNNFDIKNLNFYSNDKNLSNLDSQNKIDNYLNLNNFESNENNNLINNFFGKINKEKNEIDLSYNKFECPSSLNKMNDFYSTNSSGMIKEKIAFNNFENFKEKDSAQLKEILNYLGFFLKDIYNLSLSYEKIDVNNHFLLLQSNVISTYMTLIEYMIVNNKFFI